MKVTKDYLKQVIKEELEAVTSENDQVNEFLGLDKLLGGAVDRIKEWAAGKLLDMLEIDKESFMGKVFIDAMGNLDADELWDIITGDEQGRRCPILAKEIIEALEENLIEKLPELLGMEPENQVTKTIQEAIVNAIVKDTEFNQKLATALCDLNPKEIMKSIGVEQ